MAEAKFGTAKCGITKLYHIVPWYFRTEAIALGVVVAGDPKARAFETWLQHVLASASREGR